MHLIAKTDPPEKVKAVNSREKTAKLYMTCKLGGTVEMEGVACSGGRCLRPYTHNGRGPDPHYVLAQLGEMLCTASCCAWTSGEKLRAVQCIAEGTLSHDMQ